MSFLTKLYNRDNKPRPSRRRFSINAVGAGFTDNVLAKTDNCNKPALLERRLV
ncbi:hypothetical protein [Coleofasciculus sp.]|uniref:hypothetical protein n=1 Tax=Coleofasciculus sp. TaxID=3100458 RepID=UPI003A1F7971